MVCGVTAGTFAGLVETVAWLEPPRSVMVWFSDGAVIVAIAFLIFTCLLQKMVLRGAGVEPGYWGWATFGGLILGGIACLFVMSIAFFALEAFFQYSRRGEAIASSFGLFTIGAVVGYLQAYQIIPVYFHRRVWMIVSGSAVVVAAWSVAMITKPTHVPFHPTMYATCWGLVYGVITGGCLAWLVSRPGRHFVLGQRVMTRRDLQLELVWKGLPEGRDQGPPPIL